MYARENISYVIFARKFVPAKINDTTVIGNLDGCCSVYSGTILYGPERVTVDLGGCCIMKFGGLVYGVECNIGTSVNGTQCN
jgi:hypothetical protein